MEDTIIAADGHIDLRWLPPALCVSHAPAPWQDQVPHVRDTPTGSPGRSISRRLSCRHTG